MYECVVTNFNKFDIPYLIVKKRGLVLVQQGFVEFNLKLKVCNVNFCSLFFINNVPNFQRNSNIAKFGYTFYQISKP